MTLKPHSLILLLRAIPCLHFWQNEGGPGYVKKSLTLSGFQTYPGPPEGATTPKRRLSASLFALGLSVRASQRRGRYCSERALQPSRYGQPSRVYAVVSRTANQSKSVKLWALSSI